MHIRRHISEAHRHAAADATVGKGGSAALCDTLAAMKRNHGHSLILVAAIGYLRHRASIAVHRRRHFIAIHSLSTASTKGVARSARGETFGKELLRHAPYQQRTA
jgi:hypothetical protein